MGVPPRGLSCHQLFRVLGFVWGLFRVWVSFRGFRFFSTVLMRFYFQVLLGGSCHIEVLGFSNWGLESPVLETNLVSHSAIPPTSQNAQNTCPAQSKRTSPRSIPVLAVILPHGSLNVPMFHITQPLGIWSINVYNGYYKVMSNIPKMGHLPTPDIINTSFNIILLIREMIRLLQI